MATLSWRTFERERERERERYFYLIVKRKKMPHKHVNNETK